LWGAGRGGVLAHQRLVVVEQEGSRCRGTPGKRRKREKASHQKLVVARRNGGARDENATVWGTVKTATVGLVIGVGTRGTAIVGRPNGDT